MDTFEIYMLVCCLAVVAYHFWRDGLESSPRAGLQGAAPRAVLLVTGLAGAAALLVLVLLVWGHGWQRL